MKFLMILLIVPFVCLAQIQFIPISADYAAFNQSDSTAYVEFYIALFQGNLKYTFHGDTALSTFVTKIEISKDNTVVKESQHKYQNTIADTSTFRSYNQFVDLFAFELPYDTYSAKLQIQDLNSQLTGEYILELELKQPEEKFYLSDIELSSKLERDPGSTLFNKNGLIVVPNPRNTYDILRPVLYFYVEVYGLEPASPQSEAQYEFQYYITNNDGDTVKANPPKTKNIIASRQVEAGGFNVISMAQDVYYLNLAARDLSTNKTTVKRKKFYVHKPGKKKEIASETVLPEIDEFYSTLTKEELVKEFEMAKYIANRNEEKIFKNLETTEAIRKFLTTFWQNRDK